MVVFLRSPHVHIISDKETLLEYYCNAYCACSELWAPDVVPDDEKMAVILSGRTISVATVISSACISHQRLPIITTSPFRYLRPQKEQQKPWVRLWQNVTHASARGGDADLRFLFFVHIELPAFGPFVVSRVHPWYLS